jgi:hypothetical protein
MEAIRSPKHQTQIQPHGTKSQETSINLTTCLNYPISYTVQHYSSFTCIMYQNKLYLGARGMISCSE